MIIKEDIHECIKMTINYDYFVDNFSKCKIQ